MVLKKTIQKNASRPQKTQPDDLKLIEGIGPKISTVLNNAGVHTFAQLAEMNAVQIKGILKNGDGSLTM
jgi:large subunit ribosomal protein L21